jgi:hypothetical protein
MNRIFVTVDSKFTLSKFGADRVTNYEQETLQLCHCKFERGDVYDQKGELTTNQMPSMIVLNSDNYSIGFSSLPVLSASKTSYILLKELSKVPPFSKEMVVTL